MTDAPWRNWIPGVLSKRQVIELCSRDLIRSVHSPEESVDESSIDLSLSDEVYRLTEGSVKPFAEAPYFDRLRRRSLMEPVTADGGLYLLKKSNTYLVRLREKLSQNLHGTRIFGQATAKSSVGRVDVLVRVIIDGMSGYDLFDPNQTSEGELFAEITPIGFNVRIRPGISLAQLRLFYGDPRSAEIRGPEICRTCIHDPEANSPCAPYRHSGDGLLSVNLEPVRVGGLPVSAFEGGHTGNGRSLDLWRNDEGEKPKPWDYFRFREAAEDRLRLKPSSFYILRSKERISLPPGIAVYIRAIDETLGEMRIHYAGFAHPWFGHQRDDGKAGTPIIFEVRGHDVPAVLLHGEKLAKLTFYRMSEPAPERQGKSSGYDTQELHLSSFFADFPNALRVDDDGAVQPKEG